MPDGEKSAEPATPTVYIKSRHDDGPTSSKPLPEFNPDDLVGRTFLLPPGVNGERLRAKVTSKVVEDIEQADGERVQKLSFILGIGNGKLEQIISYDQLVDHLEAAFNEDNEISDDLYKFRTLIGHQGPLKPTDPNWKGCKYNVLVDWETQEKTYEPLSVLAADDLVTCATYAKENDLLHIDGWKRLRNLAKSEKTLTRAVMQSKIRQARRANKYMSSSPDHTRKPWNLIKRTTTPNGQMQPGMKWIASRTNKSSPNTIGQNGIQTTRKS